MFRAQARILAYHGVDQAQDPIVNFDGFQVPPDVFRRQMDVLRRRYTVLALRDLVLARQEARNLPPNSVAITFDDGYLNNLTEAAAALRDYGFPATFFVTTGFMDGTHWPWWYELRTAVAQTRRHEVSDGATGSIPVSTTAAKTDAIQRLETMLKVLSTSERSARLGRIIASCQVSNESRVYPMMSWDDARTLIAMGHEVGPHTVTHPSMAHEPVEAIRAEITASLDRIQTETGRRPLLYSYPYGEASNISDAVVDTVRKAGCIGAVTTLEGFNGSGVNSFCLRRLNVTGNHDTMEYESLLSGFTMLVTRHRHRAA